MKSLRSRRTAANWGAITSMLGVGILFTFAPASRDLTTAHPDLASQDREGPVVAGLAALSPLLPATAEEASGGSVAESDVVIVKRWDAPAAAGPAVISWWDDERWTEIENEQERWRREWLREARRNPEAVPRELWPRIVEWAPYDRTLQRYARAAVGERALRRYADDRERYWSFEWRGLNTEEEVRRWAGDVLRELRERSSVERSARERPSERRRTRRRGSGG